MRFHKKPPVYPYLPQICLALLIGIVLCLYAPYAHHRATAETAEALLAHRFPYQTAITPAEAIAQLTEALFGFRPDAPGTMLAACFPSLHAQSAPPQPLPSPTPSAPQATPPENALPILETSQTVAALKNTEGKNKQIYIDNATSYNIDIASLINEPLNLTLSADAPRVLIVHTHTTESYTPEGQTYYAPSDSTRTQDKTQNVVRVGEEIARTLTEKGINVLHDTTINDYPSYNGSYTKTLGIIEWYLERYPSIQVVLDIHRDGMTKSDGTKLKVTADVNGEKAAQIMLVIGTNEGGLTHNNWRENLKLGLRVQDQLTSLYPKLARPLNLRKERFNQHATPGSMIVEVGTDGNTLAEAITAGKYFATAFAEVLNAIK